MIGIIGLGFVGSAIKECFKSKVVYEYDKFKNINLGDVSKAEILFICLPTPTQDGYQSLDPIEENLGELKNYKGIVVIKSTVLPGTCRYLSLKYPNLDIVHNPEFLNQNTAIEDFRNQETVLISGDKESSALKVMEFYRDNLINIKRYYIHDKWETTEWAKYIHNCVLPIKLSFLNEVHREMRNQKEFDTALSMAYHFGNLGTNHKVPGPDGLKGWGGACFPKDTEALSQQYPKMNTLKAAIKTNKEVRNENSN